jgi:hypothetical protein
MLQEASECESYRRKNDSSIQGLAMFYGGGKIGFIHSALLMFSAKIRDYHNKINFENFKRCAEETFLPDVPLNGLIVMDNSAYQIVQQDTPPIQASRKWIFRAG